MTKKELTFTKMAEMSYITLPLQLTGWYQKNEVTAEVREDGSLWSDGKTFENLTSMAHYYAEKMGGYPQINSISGNHFWHMTDPASQACSTVEDVHHRVYLDAQEKIMEGISRANVLMLRLKYDIISDAQLDELHNILKDMVWRNVWNHFCTIEPKDMNSNIWLRILRKCKTWDETRNYHLTTWIWRVALSEIGKNRHSEKKRSVIRGSSLSEDGNSEESNAGQRDVPVDMEGTEKRHGQMETVEQMVGKMNGIDKELAELLMKPVYGTSGKLKIRLRSREICERLNIDKRQFVKGMKSLRTKLTPALE